MDIRELLGEFEAYYGPYDDSEGLRRSVVEYLREDILPDRYDDLRRYVLKTHPRKFGAPDVAALEAARTYAVEKDSVTLRRQVRGKSWSSAASAGEPVTDDEREEAAGFLNELFKKLHSKNREALA